MTLHLLRLIGLRKAKEIVLRDEPIIPSEAVDWGGGVGSHTSGQARRQDTELARELSDGPTQAFGAAMRLLIQSFDHSLSEQLAAETDMTGGPHGNPGSR